MSRMELCPKFEKAFQLLGKKWNGLIIQSLMDGPKRFSDIKALIPELSDRMLTERFKELEAEEIVVRSVYPDIPVRIEYSLSDKGRDLKASMDNIQKWAENWIDK
ncbi:winged helix-turn-helix transcriptional regulator [Alloiococcus sp. CFN-8]|uniref:winged helix-turn-helix transcriptional regulator n=1 Tax=Alloiococcus sp. CFN-8 TaxID=3416081 RepID=UPI003CF2E090